jgi:TatD DNase family protein
MLNGIFDSHAHYDSEDFDPDREKLIDSFASQGVVAVLNASSDIPSSRASMALTERYPFFWCGVGVHPHEAAEVDGDYIDQIEQMCAQPKVVAIGEIGLDYHYDFSPRPIQRRVFERQMKLAQQLGKPVIIHSREATEDTLEILQKFPSVTGVVHCFSGSAETAEVLLKLGYYIGFTGVVTFNNAKKVARAAQVVPLDRLLLETDCPYMAPVPLRGKRCESPMIVYTAEKLAQIKGVDAQQLVDAARENTCQLFGISL